jgi:hypothetical protein
MSCKKSKKYKINKKLITESIAGALKIGAVAAGTGAGLTYLHNSNTNNLAKSLGNKLSSIKKSHEHDNDHDNFDFHDGFSNITNN